MNEDLKQRVNYLQKAMYKPTAWAGHGLLAMALVERLTPGTIVDLGVDYGFSTFSFAYSKIGDVYGIDWFQGDENAGFRNTLPDVENKYNEFVKDYGIKINFIKDDFYAASLKWDKQIDILHIDGLHTLEAVKNDYNNWSKFCTDNSVILFHDVVSYANTVGEFFKSLDGYKYIKQDSAGLGVLTRSKKTNEILKRLFL